MSNDSVHPANLSPDQLLAQCDVTRQRRSGPGGQHRNKVETAVVLVHRPTGIRAEASERRSQAENRRVALFRLRLLLAMEVRSASTLPCDADPSLLWQSRLRGRRIEVNPAHEDFPSIVAEALDVIEQCEYDVRRAAGLLGVTGSQLVRLLRLEPRVLALVNQRRCERGLHALR